MELLIKTIEKDREGLLTKLTEKEKEVPFHIKVEPSIENGLSEVSFVKCEQILTVSKSRLQSRMGKLEPHYLEKINTAIKLVLDLEED